MDIFLTWTLLHFPVNSGLGFGCSEVDKYIILTFGRAVIDERVEKHLNGWRVICNQTVLQNLTTVARGHHSLLFIDIPHIGWSMPQIVNFLITEPALHTRNHRVVICVEQLAQII